MTIVNERTAVLDGKALRMMVSAGFPKTLESLISCQITATLQLANIPTVTLNRVKRGLETGCMMTLTGVASDIMHVIGGDLPIIRYSATAARFYANFYDPDTLDRLHAAALLAGGRDQNHKPSVYHHGNSMYGYQMRRLTPRIIFDVMASSGVIDDEWLRRSKELMKVVERRGTFTTSGTFGA